MSGGRQSRGRQKIPIRRILSQDDLYATFSKRRLGLYKKASELSTLCGVDVGVIIFSPTDVPYSFFTPTMESVLRRNNAAAADDYARLVEARARARIEECNARLDEITAEKEALRGREKAVDEEIERCGNRGWWEEDPIAGEGAEWWRLFRDRVGRRMEELKNDRFGSGPSSGFGFPGQFYFPAPVEMGFQSYAYQEDDDAARRNGPFL